VNLARRTFFSFQYKPDVNRAWIVRNSWVTKLTQGSRSDAGFFDSSVFEAAEREDPESLKRFLREGLENTSVTCVLVGETTVLSRWVRYEILRSFMCGNGPFAIRIHSIPSFNVSCSPSGSNPFDALAFAVADDRVRFREYMTTGWQSARDVGSMPLSETRYDLKGMTNHTFSCLFPIYDWQADKGMTNLNSWIESAARLAGR